MSRRTLAYIGIGLSLVAMWFFMIYAPNLQERKRQQAIADEALKQLADFDKIMSSLPAYLLVSKDLEAARLDVVSHLYAKTDILELFDHLEKTANEGHLIPLEIRPSIQELLYINTLIATTDDQPLFVNIDMRLRGGYINFGQFIETLEQTPYFRSINHCRIIGAKDNSEHDLNLEIGFKAMLGHLETSS